MSEYQLKTGKVAKKVVGAYQKVEDTVVGGYKAIEKGVVGGYKSIEKKFVEKFLEPVPATGDEDGQKESE